MHFTFSSNLHESTPPSLRAPKLSMREQSHMSKSENKSSSLLCIREDVLFGTLHRQFPLRFLSSWSASCWLISRMLLAETRVSSDQVAKPGLRLISRTDDGAFETIETSLVSAPSRRQISLLNGARKRSAQGDARYALDSSDWAVHVDRCRADFAARSSTAKADFHTEAKPWYFLCLLRSLLESAAHSFETMRGCSSASSILTCSFKKTRRAERARSIRIGRDDDHYLTRCVPPRRATRSFVYANRKLILKLNFDVTSRYQNIPRHANAFPGRSRIDISETGANIYA